MRYYDVVVVGAGAAGLFCASQIGQANLNVAVLDNGKKAGRKILLSGGGRCNFTNLSVTANNYLSTNPHFCKSALAQFTNWDFLHLVNQYHIPYHEREHGQLFCDESSRAIVQLLLAECQKGAVNFQFNSDIMQIEKKEGYFLLSVNHEYLSAKHLVIATGGLAYPKLGATPFGYKIAQQFGHEIVPTRAGLVPLTLKESQLHAISPLSGVSLPAQVSVRSGINFEEELLFTHRGLSGPVILQASNYWQLNEPVVINLLPNQDLLGYIDLQQKKYPNRTLKTVLSSILPKSVTSTFLAMNKIENIPLNQLTQAQKKYISIILTHWEVIPNGTEGYRTAEVTIGGVDTHAISSKSMASQRVNNLYFIGEVLDVTGWLGGYNFQWAWSSATVCATAIIQQHE